jgi:tRNA modification GTPase
MLTGRQSAAIGSVALAGKQARPMLEKVFRSGRKTTAQFQTGAVVHGHLLDGERTLDEVVVGCEADDYFVVHCHGNPLLTGQAVKLFERMGASLMDTEDFLLVRYRSESETLIEAEAKQWVSKAATLNGAKIVSSQLTEGLLPIARRWLDELDAMSREELWAQCHQVLRKTSRARYLINRCKIVLVGPPNSGKSTLFNRLAGRDDVIVSEIAGTTRDWVSMTCQFGPLMADLYDTAGLDAQLTEDNHVERMAQQASLDLVHSADMNIFVYDVTKVRQAQLLLFSIGGMKGVIAANKCDQLTDAQRDTLYSKYVPISAKTGDGIDRLIHTVTRALKVCDYDVSTPVCFTDRQLDILRQLIHTKEKEHARTQIESLLFGHQNSSSAG